MTGTWQVIDRYSLEIKRAALECRIRPVVYFCAMSNAVPKLGSFCWIELATTDQAAAKHFYGSLFGWTANDVPIGPPGQFYTMFQLAGRQVAAGYTLRPDQLTRGVPPHWGLYILVESADATAERIAKAGGNVLMPPFDALDVGRMAVIKDPAGAAFSIWQAKKSGEFVTAEPGALCWADLNSPDPVRATRFYTDVFGWNYTVDTHSDPPSGYLHIQNGSDFIGGVPPLRPESARIPPHWLSYFQVADCDSTAARAREMGAKFCLEPFTMENVGRFAILDDPQGAAFAIFQPMPRK